MPTSRYKSYCTVAFIPTAAGARSALNRTRQESIRRCIPARRLKPLPGPFAKYTLTRICVVEYMKSMESVFEIIAEPNRRAILSLLVSSQQSVGEIERQLRMTQPTVSKHLRVLREAGFVGSTGSTAPSLPTETRSVSGAGCLA